VGRTVLVVTGEPSGDLAASRFVEQLRLLDPAVRVFAVGGERLRAAGATLLADIRDLGAMGFVEVIRQMPRLRALEAKLVRFLDEERPSAVVPVDYPGFNLRIAEHAKARGIPVVYYIAPQVWAWGRERVRRIARCVDHLLVVLPFEEPLFREAGIPTTFVGHPLLEGLEHAPSRAEARASLGIPAERPVLGLLPGSRVQEVRLILPRMLDAARIVRGTRADLDVLVSRASSVPEAEIDARIAGQTGTRAVGGEAARVVRAADVLFVTSGTATLEAALLGTPLAVVYRTSAITWMIGRSLVRLPRIGLVNIVAGEELAPEFLQDAARPAALARFAADLLDRPVERERIAEKLRALRGRFQGRSASRSAAEIVLGAMEGAPA
jgi:lipid-A-disaccharide synthase